MSDLHAQLLARCDDSIDLILSPGPFADALRAVVELHAPTPCIWHRCDSPRVHEVCQACGSGVAADDCPTLRAIAGQIGIGEHKSVNEKEEVDG